MRLLIPKPAAGCPKSTHRYRTQTPEVAAAGQMAEWPSG